MNCECRQIAPLIAGAVDDQLTAEQWELLEKHLECCESCRSLLDQEQEIVLVMEGLEPGFMRTDAWAVVQKHLPGRGEAARPILLLAIVALGSLLKPVDLFFAGELGLVLRFAALLIVVLAFALVGENPFRLASDGELRIATEAARTQGA